MTIFWSITKLGRSVRRVIREGSLALFRTSYKELSQHGIHLSSGVHHLFLKRDKFHSESASFTLAITCLLLLFLTDFSQVSYCWKAIFKENPMLYVMKGEDYSLWKTSAITEIAPLRSSWRQLVYIQSELILFGHFLLCLGCFSFIFHCWESSLVCISGRNMGSTSSITRVWDIGIVDRLGRLKLDLEAVVEDANEKVYSFQIQRSLIYLKFVGGVGEYLILSQNHTKNRLFIINPS